MRKYGKQTAVRRAEDKGFYIILVLCLAAIGISGYVLFFAPSGEQDEGMDTAIYTPAGQAGMDDTEEDSLFTTAGGAEDIPLIQTPEEDVTAETETPDEASMDAADPAQQEVNAAVSDIPVDTPAAETEPETQETAAPSSVWVRPTAGDVIAAYSGDNLVYQETFEDWRVHAGTDYAGDSGARVYAVADGTVDLVEQDALWGTCITLSLADGRTAVYRGLSSTTKVKTGATVKAGDILGTVGESIPAEAAQGAHLHFEMTDANGAIDPETLFSEEAQKTAGEADVPIPSGIDVEE